MFKVPRSSSKPKKDYGRIGEGTYPARVVQIIGVGKQENINFATKQPMLDREGNPQQPSPKVMVTYELPTQLIDVDGEDKPRWISKEYNLFFSDNAALTKVLNSVANGSDDLDDLLSVPCLLQIGTTSGGKDKIVSVAKPIDGMEVADLANETRIFNFDDPDLQVYNSLFNWQKQKMQEAVNFQNSKLEFMLSQEYEAGAKADANSQELPDDEDIPF